jgi:hypothetical protein
VYTVGWTTSDDAAVTSSTTNQVLIACSQVCCVDALAAKVTIDMISCGCSNNYYTAWKEAKDCLDLAFKAANCGKYNLSTLFLQKVDQICLTNKCSC